ncbi:MAG: hypothetical protein NTZ63_02010 [Candidatus Omnitrophica bacterium]|nr:hypothetical protein [Candidatus Omnitrophota bacterium]
MFLKKALKKCVISLGINSKSRPGCPPKIWQDFPRGIRRIRERLKELGFKGDFIGWDNDYPEGAPVFKEVNDWVKPFCFLDAYKRGYDLVLWVDSAANFKISPEPLFRIIEKRGYLIINADCDVGKYCSDVALEALGLTRKKSFSLKSCWGAVLGLDFRKKKSLDLVYFWKEKATDGITFYGAKWSGIHGYPISVSADPRVKGHRNQIVPSVAAYRLGMLKWMNKRELYNKYITIEREYVRMYDEDNGKVEER